LHFFGGQRKGNYDEGKKAYKHVYISYNGNDEEKEQHYSTIGKCACAVLALYHEKI
jgi:hypothetical protein